MSYRELDRELVIKACENYLARRSEKIRNIQEEEIEKARTPRWFRRRELTREEAIKELEEDEFSWYSSAIFYGASNAGKVCDLLRLCNIVGGPRSGSTVNVSAEHANILYCEFEDLGEGFKGQ